MKKVLFFWLYVGFLYGIENNAFIGFGSSFGSTIHTDFSQVITKDNNTCEGSVCIGGKSSATYKGHISPTFRFILGNEAIFNKLHISGLRIYGGIEVAQASLGNIQGEVQTQTPRDASFDTIVGEKSDGSPDIQKVAMLSPKAQQDFLLSNAISTTLSLNLDFFLNFPIDYFFQKKWKKFPFMKIGIFAGLGAEFNLLKSNYWINQSLYDNQESAFYASGSGVFFNLGGHFYLTRHDRLEFGVKIPCYNLKQDSWKAVNTTTNIWAEQTLKQSFEIKKDIELRIAYVFYF